MIKFPYGISDFYQIITENYFYIDRTDRIPLVERIGKQLLFLRPRRFGKSLWLSTLENYYDVAKADEFETLFGHLAIGQNPTPLHNRYVVMRWDFSLVDPQGNVAEIKRSLHNHINAAIERFTQQYQSQLHHTIERDPTDALRSFQSLLTAVQQTPYHLYLLIDEYDNFANTVLMSDRPDSQARYEALLYGEGALKTVFKAVKAASGGLGLDRVFITGISPVALNDVTSGYNVAKHISLEPGLHDLCGFWETEIITPLQHIGQACDLPPEKVASALTTMSAFYDGYTFSHDSEGAIYNPTLALYFMDYFQHHCQSPANMLDSNFAMDRQKLAYISHLRGGEALILDALQEETPISVFQLADQFGMAEMLAPAHDTPFMASLLYYLGILTLGEKTALGKMTLRIPNLVVRKLYVEHIQRMLLPAQERDAAQQAAETLYSTGDMQPLCDFIEQRYFKVFDNRDYYGANELTVKTAFLTLLFNDIAYIMDSETALERGYADLTMIVRPEMRQYQLLDILIEFKYVGLKKAGLTGEQARRMSRDEIKSLADVQASFREAITQLRDYRRRLETKYREKLRLRAYAVVSLGFDRLVWEEIR